MNFELADQLSGLLRAKKLDAAIQLAEGELKKIPETDFHLILGKDLLHLTHHVISLIQEFDHAATTMLKRKQGFIQSILRSKSKVRPAAYSCEMNGFTINYDRWFIALFSFETYSTTDWDWLSDFYASTAGSLTITGFEDLQKAFESFHENHRFEKPNLKPAYEVCELLVILRLQELLREVYLKDRGEWSHIPMFVTAHDYELIYQVN